MRTPSTAIVALAAATAACIAFAVAPAEDGTTPTGAAASGVPPLAEDAGGDANALNGQGLQDIDSTSTAPVQVEDADILAARITSTWDTTRGSDGLLDRTFTGIEFRTRLAAAPGPDSVPVLHRFIGTVDGCETWVQFAVGGTGGAEHGTATVRLLGPECGIPDDAVTDLRGSRTFSGEGIAWHWDGATSEAVVTVDATVVDAQLAERIVDGALYELSELHVRHRVSPTRITAPVIDEMPGQDGYVHLGSDVPSDQAVDGGHTGGDGNDVPRDTASLCGRHDGGGTGTEPTRGSDRTGVHADSLRFGVHGPATGAAPLPTTSFEQARDLYWQAVTEDCEETVLGRSAVEVVFHDDKYDPSSAGRVCREMAIESFLLFGAGGTDQVQRCGQLADVSGFPYLSVGATEAGLTGNPWYFGSTMSFREQGGLLAEYVAANPDDVDVLGGDAAIGSIVTDTPNFDDAVQGWHEGLSANGLQSQVTFRHPKGDTSWYAAAAEDFQQRGVEVVYFLSSPVDLIQFANTAHERFGYDPLYVGVASDTSLDAVLASGCDGAGSRLDGAVWLSGTPGLDVAPTAFLEAAELFDAPADDIALRLWAFAEQQRDLLEGYEEVFGHDLTREDFRAFVEGNDATTAGTFPPATWSPADHFPSEAMHVVRADCETEQHVTLHVDARGF